MKVYTKTGDSGKTSLVGGRRVPKTDDRLEAYGAIDEFSAFLANLRDNINAETLLNDMVQEEKDELVWVQSRLMVVSSHLASDIEFYDKLPKIKDEDINRVEDAIDRISEQLEPLTKFTIAGGHTIVSLSHIARTVCRRAERCSLRVAEKESVDSNPLVFLNRLSDYLYVLGRLLTLKLEISEIYWDGK